MSESITKWPRVARAKYNALTIVVLTLILLGAGTLVNPILALPVEGQSRPGKPVKLGQPGEPGLGLPDRALAKQSPKGMMVDAYRFTQICKTVGVQEITLTKGAIKVKHRNSGMVAIFREPFDVIVFFNSASKKSVSLPLAKYVSPFAYTWTVFFARSISGIPLVKVGPYKFRDQQSSQYRSTDQFSRSQESLYAKKDIPARCVKTLLYTVADKFDSFGPQNKFLQKMYGLPEVEGLPLELVFHDLHATKKTYFTTGDIKSLKVSQAEFDVPKGLIPVHKIEEVTTDLDGGNIELFK